MAGVGVIYYVLGLVRAHLRDEGWFRDRTEPNLADWLDLVALGTVADVVPLDRNNRVLVHQGVVRMRAGRCRPGIRALAEVAGRELPKLSAQDLGFALGPRLNAAGRLDDMSAGHPLPARRPGTRPGGWPARSTSSTAPGANSSRRWCGMPS
jgi:single-stranded-DNA-specific exonuclease